MTRSLRRRTPARIQRPKFGYDPSLAPGIGAVRFDLKYSAVTLPHEAMLRSIELYGREVIPRVRELLAAEPAAAAVTV